MSQTVFVLEDDADISRLVQHHLEAAGFETRIFHTPTNLIPDAERQPPALFLLDIMVPGGDGLNVCRRLRNHDGLSTIPIIFLTARAGENDRVLGLELGADDYITKPFATRELVARVKAVLRRFERPSSPAIITFEEVVIDANAMQLKVRGALTTTTATSSVSSTTSRAIRAVSSAATISSTLSGAMPASSLRVPSMSMCAASVRKSKSIQKIRAISRPYVAPAIVLRSPRASRRPAYSHAARRCGQAGINRDRKFFKLFFLFFSCWPCRCDDGAVLRRFVHDTIGARSTISREALWSGLIALVVALVLAVFAASRITARLERVIAFARRIAQGDLSARLETAGGDESPPWKPH